LSASGLITKGFENNGIIVKGFSNITVVIIPTVVKRRGGGGMRYKQIIAIRIEENFDTHLFRIITSQDNWQTKLIKALRLEGFNDIKKIIQELKYTNEDLTTLRADVIKTVDTDTSLRINNIVKSISHKTVLERFIMKKDSYQTSLHLAQILKIATSLTKLVNPVSATSVNKAELDVSVVKQIEKIDRLKAMDLIEKIKKIEEIEDD